MCQTCLPNARLERVNNFAHCDWWAGCTLVEAHCCESPVFYKITVQLFFYIQVTSDASVWSYNTFFHFQEVVSKQNAILIFWSSVGEIPIDLSSPGLSPCPYQSDQPVLHVLVFDGLTRCDAVGDVEVNKLLGQLYSLETRRTASKRAKWKKRK